MCEWGDVVVVPKPEWSDRTNPVFDIDRCILDTVQELWRRDVRTIASCCGHGKGSPSLVLSAAAAMPALARLTLADIDPRTWILEQWQLVDVSSDSAGGP